MLIIEAKYTLLCFWEANVQPKEGKPLRDTLAIPMIKMLTGSYEPCDNIRAEFWFTYTVTDFILAEKQALHSGRKKYLEMFLNVCKAVLVLYI